MTIQFIPISAVPSQTFTIQLGTQNCTINLNQKSTGLFFDLFIDGSSIGQLAFIDMQGTSDPYYTGLGSQYLMIYKS